MNSDGKQPPQSLPGHEAPPVVGSGSSPVELPEALLWAYADGTLGHSQEEKVVVLLAQNEKAQETLEKIRQALARAATEVDDESSEVTLSTVARTVLLKHEMHEIAKRLLTSAAAAGSTVAAVLVRVREGLVAPFVSADWARSLRPAFSLKAGGVRETEANADASARYDFVSPDQTKISVIGTPGRGVDVVVQTADPAVSGIVTLFELSMKNDQPHEKDTGIHDRLKNGVAQLRDCPDGLLKITLPGGRFFILGVVSPNQSADSHVQ